jgi:chitinase
VICCANVSSQTAPQGSHTGFTYTSGLEAARPFTLRLYALDAAGNYSKPSNSVTFTTPPDRIPPTKPLVSVTNVGSTYVSLMWSSIEDGPHVWYSVYMNGNAVAYASRDTSNTITLLEPETTYTFTVQARDFGGNSSPLSDAVTATTGAINTDDTTPPSTPANLYEQNWGCEVELDWDESTDDFDPQWLIEYEVYVNGVYDHSLSLRYTRTIVYGTVNGPNTFSVVAVDTVGNKSEPATVTTNLSCP